jgi:hypothetical protein
MSKLLHAFLALVLVGVLASPAAAQAPQAAPAPQAKQAAQPPKQRLFPTAEAAADTLTEALRKDDDNAIAAILGSRLA